MIHFMNEAVDRTKALAVEQGLITNPGIRIRAKQKGFHVKYQLLWEELERTDDIVYDQGGLKIYIDADSALHVKDTVVFLTEQDGKEGLYIMKNTSVCATCSMTCL
ncbi:Fe-S cluster assembly iron-binding protein IscA [Evansella caseinilytica]|uniref:Fe-S cluster assembly iron-binding protein IscA n=1 Tax=Evansella caseinilytica TaxID=1503961 RepID=A0A1H3IB25_9BACI|nr:hypothetical protein [Evansella caseinilytica]SDY24449.1 Fe-S cluster assembly iron-binding protein IscA [Evansella caseinilytica]